MTALLTRWQVIPANFVVFCNRSNFCHPSYATEGKNNIINNNNNNTQTVHIGQAGHHVRA